MAIANYHCRNSALIQTLLQDSAKMGPDLAAICLPFRNGEVAKDIWELVWILLVALFYYFILYPLY
jgi:hypothetical protein